MTENEKPNMPALANASQLPTLKSEALQLQVADLEGDVCVNLHKFEHLQRVSKVFASSGLVPQLFQGNLANCFIAIHLSTQLMIDPFVLMQKMYVVHGKPGIEGQLAIALVNKRGPYPDGVRFEYSGSGDTRACLAYGVRKDGSRDECSCSVQDAKKNGWWDKKDSKWPVMTDQMLAYRSGAWLGLRYCPEALLGLLTIEELMEMGAINRVGDGGSDSMNEKLRELNAA